MTQQQAAAGNPDRRSYSDQAPGTPFLTVKGLSFTYADRPILQDVNFTLCTGDFAAIVGANGAGKSTLMRLCLGLLGPYQGEILLHDEPLSQAGVAKHIAYVPQKATTRQAFPATVLETVTASLYPVRRGRRLGAADLELAQASLDRLGMGAFAQQRLDSLSGGEYQKVMLAAALVKHPCCIFLDEPTGGVDEYASNDIYALLTQLNEENGLTILMINHQLERVASCASVIYHVANHQVTTLTPQEYVAQLSQGLAASVATHKTPEV